MTENLEDFRLSPYLTQDLTTRGPKLSEKETMPHWRGRELRDSASRNSWHRASAGGGGQETKRGLCIHMRFHRQLFQTIVAV